MQKKLLLTGASGFLGHHIIRIAASSYQVYGLFNSNPVSLPGTQTFACDLCDYIALGNLIEVIEPDAIIHTAAIADANYCQLHPTESQVMNVEASVNLAGLAADWNIPFVFTSTDLVFDGKKGNYKEDDTKNPLGIYGEQKAMAEEQILAIYSSALIVRLPLLFGIPEASNGNYLHKLLTDLRNGRSAPLFHDEYRSMTGTRNIVNGILQLMDKVSGVVHLAGSEKLSRYAFGKMVTDAFQLDESLLKSCSQLDVKMAAPRPPDVSLNIEKAISLGYQPITVREELNAIASDKYL